MRNHSGKNPEFLNEILNSYVHASHANYFVDWYGNGDILLAEQRVFGQYAFFGITEFLGESIYALAEIFPCLKQEKVIYNKVVAPKHGMAISKIAEECFYEKNAKDMELYEKAVKEFKRRTASRVSDVELKTIKEDERPIVVASDAYEPVGMPRISEGEGFGKSHSRKVYEAYRSLGTSDECWKNFFDDVAQCNRPEYKLYEFWCNVRFKNGAGMDACGNFLFDAIDNLREGGKATSLVDEKLNILTLFVNACPDYEKWPFFEKCRKFLSSLHEMPEWRAKAMDVEADLLGKHGEFDEALALTRKAAALQHDSFHVNEKLCRFLFMTGAFSEAEDTARNELRRFPHWEWTWRFLAQVLLITGKRGEAEIYLRKVLAKNPGWFNGQQALLNILIDKGALDEAEIAAREYFACCTKYWLRYDILISLSRIFESRGDIDAAINELRSAIRNFPGVVIFHEALTALLLRNGRIAEAEKDAQANVETFPGQGWPFLQLSQLCEARGDMEQGLGYARKAYALQPGKLTLAANLARFLRLSGNNEEFDDFCQREKMRDARQGWVWRELCRMAEKRGNRELALEMGAKAIAVHPVDGCFLSYYDTLRASGGMPS